jgi:hypothetical protein
MRELICCSLLVYEERLENFMMKKDTFGCCLQGSFVQVSINVSVFLFHWSAE